MISGRSGRLFIVFHCSPLLLITFSILVSMDVWCAQFRANRQRLLDDDDEDDVVLNFILQLRYVNSEQALPSIRGGFRPKQSPNIERFRVEMHHRMTFDYFCHERCMCQKISVDDMACNVQFFR